MKIVASPMHQAHQPAHEFEGGRLIPAKDQPARAELVLDALRSRGLGTVVAPQHFGLEPVLRVHAPDFVHFLEQAWARWVAKHGYEARAAYPSAWPARGLRDVPTGDVEAALGYYAFDTATPIVAGTWAAARAAANAALTAAGHVARGDRAAFALTRPPGHHASADVFGGYCFLNNAAIAAQALRDRGMRVAVLDPDMHHGNGTQSLFYDTKDVLTVSIHGDPDVFYPHYLGFADERGSGAGEGFNLNLPLPEGTDWPRYADALETALGAVRDFAPDVLVVPLGVDTHDGDPAGGFRLKGDDYKRLGKALAGLSLPSVITMEGGYRLDTLGAAFSDVLAAFEGA
jgi:acetoin utilization deacetylase AcuC-like enzyme